MKKTIIVFSLILTLTSSALAPTVKSQYLGAVLASAIGDAMGKVTEFKNMQQIYAYYPHGVQGFESFLPQDWYHMDGSPWQNANGVRFAPFTDDTQMAVCVLKSLIGSARLLEKIGPHTFQLEDFMKSLAFSFIRWSLDPDGGQSQDRAPGNACLNGCQQLMINRVHRNPLPSCTLDDDYRPSLGYRRDTVIFRRWDVGAVNAGGCGSVMRAFPFGLALSHKLDTCEFLSVEHSKLTHGHPWALAACGAMAVGMAEIINGKEVDEVLDVMTETARKYDTETADLIEWAREQARNNVDSKEVFDRLRGWTAHEAIAAAVYIFDVSSDDVVQAIRLGVNTPGDSDSIAAMAGALVGARCGIEALPPKWVSTIEKSQELKVLASQLYVSSQGYKRKRTGGSWSSALPYDTSVYR